MTRLGKIARLPRALREELNRRLDEGEMGKRLVCWLNAQPEAQAVLAAEFGGRAINEQNLSEWKQGGFADWQRHREALAWVGTVAHEAEELEAESGDIRLAEQLATQVALALGRRLHELLKAPQDAPAKLKELLEISQELAQLRRGNHNADRVRVERERWEKLQREEQEKKEHREEWDKRWAVCKADRDANGIPRNPDEYAWS